MIDATLSEIRSIIQRRTELAVEDDQLHRRLLALLELDQSSRKSSRKMLSNTHRRMLFAEQKRCAYERGKAQ